MKRTVIIVPLSLLAAGAVFLSLPLRTERPPDIILISVDSLRPDHLGCYGYGRETSPRIDRLARDGALFETAVSSTSWTLPAHAALFTGLADRVHGCFDDRRWLDGSRTTLAERLREAGYHTAGFFSGPYLHPSFGLAQGFDEYHDCTSYSGKTLEHLREGAILNDRGILRTDLAGEAHRDVTNPILLAEVRKWLADRPERPFFLFIHMWDVHYDYVPPPPWNTKFDPGYSGPVDGRNVLSAARRPSSWSDDDVEHLKALYDGEIAWTDATIAKILGALDARGLEKESIICVTSDHGEAFYEHGAHGHRWSLYEEEIRIPLVIRAPGRIPAGRRIGELAHVTDIAPTLLELAGAPPLPHATGRSLVPLLAAPERPWPDEDVVCELEVPAHQKHHFALRGDARKVIYDLNDRRIYNFDLAADPNERSPHGGASVAELFSRYEEAARRLEEAAARLPVIGERDTPPIDAMTEEELRRHGYLK